MNKVGRFIRENLVQHIKEGCEKNNNTFVVSYTKVSGPKMNTLRRNLKQVGARVFVSKNKLAQKALQELKQERIANRLKGQTALVWSNADAVEISKALMKFVKGTEGVLIEVGFVDGSLLEKSDVERLSNLPSKDVLQVKLLQTMLAPATRLAYALNAKTRDLLSILKQLSEKKGGN